METQSLKEVFYSDEDFVLEIEKFKNMVGLHCEVRNWKPSVLKRGYRVFVQLEEQMKLEGYEFLITATPNPNFARMFGGTAIHTLVHNGIEHEVIKWELK